MSALDRIRHAQVLAAEEVIVSELVGNGLVFETAPDVVDMVLYCPKCGMQHVDAPEPPVEHDHGAVEFPAWDNPPHRSHLCHACGCIWRPADVPTNGVMAVKTRGKSDNYPVEVTHVE